MTLSTPADVTLQTYSTGTEKQLQDALHELSGAGLSSAIRIFHPGPQAALEWLIPTALMLWIGEKYCGAFLEEAGKEHYQALKRFTSRVFEKTLGNEATVTRTMRMVGGGTKPDVVFSGNLSIVYQAPSGWTVKLLFPLDITSAQYEVACQRFAELISAHVARPETSPLSFEAVKTLREASIGLPQSLQTQDRWKTVRLLVFWNSTSEIFYVPDPIASGRQGKLVARELGAEA